MVLRPTSYPRFLSAPRNRVYPHVKKCGAPHFVTYVKWADMWSWEGHAGRCTGLIAVSFT
jgi:hypothetical protein